MLQHKRVKIYCDQARLPTIGTTGPKIRPVSLSPVDNKEIMTPRKEWRANYNGHEIKVIYTWINNLQLLIDDELKDEVNIKAVIGFSEDVFLTSSVWSENGAKMMVEVFVKPTLWSIEVRICVGSNEIGGEVIEG
jgi:hypothetical protein